MKTKILVTGGTGYIGSHTAVSLIESGYEVVLIDNLSNSSKETVVGIQEITGTKPKLEVVDLTYKKQCADVFAKHNDAKGLIHFAALKAVGESVKRPLQYYYNNLSSLMNTLECTVDNQINNFIFSSSATVYGKPDNVPISEDFEMKRPFSPYGNSKKIAEEIMEDFIVSNDSLSIISLRYFNPIGAHESGIIGELPTGTPNNLMPYITQVAAGVREKLLVFGNDYPTRDGTPIRDYIHVVDLAEAHLKALKRLLDRENEKTMEVFNLGSGKGYTVLEIIHAFEKVSGKQLNYEVTARREGDVPELISLPDLANIKLQWKAKRDLSEMVKSAWEWEKKIRTKVNGE
ncbi:UDP-glucose 4-epimerase GalE [Flagellimonas flava]|uniref:UDP-glucose 4-epimerase GalE n=1 Tax=Flagellimonas flava TaxID=570519 RepID=UPI003D651C9B